MISLGKAAGKNLKKLQNELIAHEQKANMKVLLTSTYSEETTVKWYEISFKYHKGIWNY